MAKGDVTPLTFTSEIDPVTHARVVRLTPRDRIFHRNYFYQKCFLQGGTQLLIGGVDDGNWNYWLLDLQQHTLRQLTEGPGDNSFDGFITEDDRALIFMRHNRHIVRVELDTLREEVLYELPAQWVSTSAWMSSSRSSIRCRPGRIRSTPGWSSDGNSTPQSIISNWPLISKLVLFRPTSPSPPRGITRRVSRAGLGGVLSNSRTRTP